MLLLGVVSTHVVVVGDGEIFLRVREKSAAAGARALNLGHVTWWPPWLAWRGGFRGLLCYRIFFRLVLYVFCNCVEPVGVKTRPVATS